MNNSLFRIMVFGLLAVGVGNPVFSNPNPLSTDPNYRSIPFDETMHESFFLLEGLPKYQVKYDVLLTYHFTQEVKLGMYDPQLPQDQIDRWVTAQSRERSQPLKRVLKVFDHQCVWEETCDAGVIFIKAKNYQYTVDFKTNQSTIQDLAPSFRKNTFSKNSMISNHHVHFLVSPAQLFGFNQLPLYLPPDALTIQEPQQDQNQTTILVKETGDTFCVVNYHPEHDRIDSITYVFDPVFVKEVQYSGYETNETLGIVVPKKITIKKYYTKSLEERSLENLQTTQEITIKEIELID